MTGPRDHQGEMLPDLPGGDTALCAEYVLGLLSAPEAQALEARLESEPALQAEVVYWAEHFADIADTVPEVAPPPAVLQRLELRAFGSARPPFWRQLLPYLVGAVVAATVAWMVNFSGLLNVGPEAPHLYAELRADERGLQLLAHWAPDSETLMVRRDAGDLPEGRSLQIWILPASGTDPIPMGLIVPEQLTEIPVPGALQPLIPGATVAISEEPEGGSPTGAPTGPILASGSLG